MIREREASNPKYICLNEPESKEAVYYRWKVYSLCMGDKEDDWREKPFQITVGSPFYIPPKVSSSFIILLLLLQQKSRIYYLYMD